MDDEIRTGMQIANQVRQDYSDEKYKKRLRQKTEQLPDAVTWATNGRYTGSTNDTNKLFRAKKDAEIRNNRKNKELLKNRLRRNNNKKALSIRKSKNYVNESAAPMDNTQVVYQTPSGKTMSTYTFTPEQLAEALSEKTIHPVESAIFTGATAAPLIAFSAPTLYSGGMYALTHPVATVGGFVGGSLGNEAVNLGINYFSDGKYTSFGDLMGTDSDSKFLWEFANPGGLIGGFKGWKYGNNVEKRALETVMRTSGYLNPLNNIVTKFHMTPPDQRKAIANYILFKKRNNTVPYNYFGNTPYTGTLYYSMGYKGDMIDAFLYGTELDPAIGRRIATGENFGLHTDYVSQAYPFKSSKIPVYELNVPSKRLTHMLHNLNSVKPTGEVVGVNNAIPLLGNGNLDVGGHLLAKGIDENGNLAVMELDIWKFNPKEYYNRWIADENASWWKNLLIKYGLGVVDSHGTPVITRTPWMNVVDDK